MLPEVKDILQKLLKNYSDNQDKEAFFIKYRKEPRPTSGKPFNFG